MKNNFFNKTTNGVVFMCSTCNEIHIEFKNLNFNFDIIQFDNFVEYISNLDGIKWEKKNFDSSYKRKIVIPIGHAHFKILLNNTELTELKQLLNPKLKHEKGYRVIKAQNLGLTYCNN